MATNTVYTDNRGVVWIEGTTGNNVWPIWANTVTSGQTYSVAPEVGETPEERKRRSVEAKKKTDERESAQGRAKALLKSLLTPEQKKHLDEVSSFLVRSESERLFRIRRDRTVEELDDGDAVVARYCIHHPYGSGLPAADTMLAQKLMLEMNEAKFMEIANRTRV